MYKVLNKWDYGIYMYMNPWRRITHHFSVFKEIQGVYLHVHVVVTICAMNF